MNGLIPVTPSGFLVSIAKNKPSKVYSEAINQILLDILNELGEKEIRSVVLRGSIACHTEILGISDLDIVVFVYNYSEEIVARLSRLAARETKRWRSIVSLVDLSCAQYDLLFSDVHYNRLYLNLKLTGITLWGEDLLSHFPNIECNRPLAVKIARQTWIESLQTYNLINDESHIIYMGMEKGCEFLCVWFMRSFCRGLIVPVMLERNVFSLNVQTCAQLFIDLCPQYSKIVEICRVMECEPTKEWDVLKQIARQCVELYRNLCLDYDISEVLNE